MAYSYFERPILLLLSIPVLLVINIPLGVLSIIPTLSGSVLRRMVPFLRSGVDDRYVGRDVTDVYRLDFLVKIILNKMAFLPIL